MGLFDKFKGRKEPERSMAPQEAWDNAFKANVNFYGKEGEEPFGALVLTEGVETVLPVTPWERYGLDGKPVADWRLVLVSTTEQGILGMLDYRKAVDLLRPYLQEERADMVLTRGLTLEQIRGLLK
ncbi:MAG: DUF4299 domain-containing protein [Oscillospiraceae bacterium]|nr:DUF4299 domain-containing protein [Oscillospiraceae bacterium]